MLVKPAADTAKRQIDEEKRPKDRAGEAEDGVEEEAEFEGTAGLGQIVAAEDQPQPHRDIQHVYPEKDAARRSAIIALPGERRQRAAVASFAGGGRGAGDPRSTGCRRTLLAQRGTPGTDGERVSHGACES